jgi:hypothetical protein
MPDDALCLASSVFDISNAIEIKMKCGHIYNDFVIVFQLMIHLLNAYMNLMTLTPQFQTWNMKYDEEANKELATFLMDELIHG